MYILFSLWCFTANYPFIPKEKKMFLNLPLEGNLRLSTREKSDND